MKFSRGQPEPLFKLMTSATLFCAAEIISFCYFAAVLHQGEDGGERSFRLRVMQLRLLTKSYSPPNGGRIALSANEKIAEFLDFAIQAKFAYVNKLHRSVELRFLI